MDRTDWKKIFKEKSTPELIAIYIGDSFLDFDCQILAGVELLNRGYDKVKVLEIAKSLKAELIEKLEESTSTKSLNDYKDKQQRMVLITVVTFAFLFIYFAVNAIATQNINWMFLIALPLMSIMINLEKNNRIKKFDNERAEKATRINLKLDQLQKEIINNII
ncbi:MAG: hypothetical protein AB9888_11750 [Bacteroidales bacterium]|jgi:hypothetical protein